MKRKVYAMLAVTVVIFGCICARLYYITQSTVHMTSILQSTRVQTMAVVRGTIYDRHEVPIVNSKSRWIASVAPGKDILQLLPNYIHDSMMTKAEEEMRSGNRVIVESDSPFPDLNGIVQADVPFRYETEALAPHVIGYVDGEYNGVTGVELAYDDTLNKFRGAARVVYQTDALGRAVLDGKESLRSTISNATGGIALTLDSQIQLLSQRIAAEMLDRGAVLISDVNSGQVLASVSLPMYDQNNVDSYLDDSHSPLMDRTLATYNCGSVFKIITAAAALEQGIDPSREYTCTGSYRVGETVFYCHNKTGDGTIAMKQAMAKSCNIYFIKLALEMGEDALFSMAEKAGFSDSLVLAGGYRTKTSEFPSVQSLAVDAALANVAIGQGDTLTTVYHIHQTTMAVAKGGEWCLPTLYYGKVDTNGAMTVSQHQPEIQPLFSKYTAEILQDMMKEVVLNGTGTSARPERGTAGGKTGTAETGWMEEGSAVIQSWFTGYYPAEDPAFVITVLSENGGSNGKTAGKVFSRLCDALFSAGMVEIP